MSILFLVVSKNTALHWQVPPGILCYVPLGRKTRTGQTLCAPQVPLHQCHAGLGATWMVKLGNF